MVDRTSSFRTFATRCSVLALMAWTLILNLLQTWETSTILWERRLNCFFVLFVRLFCCDCAVLCLLFVHVSCVHAIHWRKDIFCLFVVLLLLFMLCTRDPLTTVLFFFFKKNNTARTNCRGRCQLCCLSWFTLLIHSHMLCMLFLDDLHVLCWWTVRSNSFFFFLFFFSTTIFLLTHTLIFQPPLLQARVLLAHAGQNHLLAQITHMITSHAGFVTFGISIVWRVHPWIVYYSNG